MATTLRDFGLAPEEPQSTPPRRRRYVIEDESGARPLPRDEYQAREDVPKTPMASIRSTSRSIFPAFRANEPGSSSASASDSASRCSPSSPGSTSAATSVAPALGPTPAESSLPGDPQRPFEEAQTIEALERARIAPVWLAERSGASRSDFHTSRIAGHPSDRRGSAARSPRTRRPRASARRVRPSSGASGEELDAENPYSGKPSNESGLSNELDELQRSLRPRGPTAPPKEPPTSTPTMPEEPALPPPAAPTAPAETIPPAGSNQTL